DRIMGEGNALVINSHIDNKKFLKPEKDEGVRLMSALLGYMVKVQEWYPAMAGMYSKILRNMSPDAVKLVEKLVEHDDEINPLSCNGEEVYKRSKRLLEILGFDPEKEEQDAKDQKKADEQLSEAAEEFAKEIFKHFHTDRDVEEHSETSSRAGLGNPDARKNEAKAKLKIDAPIP
ncbi:MAG: hypothetical protein QQN63_14650, partial [Nitrosopumilus sp.]